MQVKRIPLLAELSFDGMLTWFAEMSVRGLLFCPSDPPEDIIVIATGAPLFTKEECVEVGAIIDRLFEAFGDGVHDAVYPIGMKAFGQRLDA